MRPIFSKLRIILTPGDRKTVMLLIVLMLFGMMFEMLGIGLIIPTIAILMQEDLIVRFPAIQPVFGAFGNPSHHTLVVAAMLVLVGVYFSKVLFLGFLAWRQLRFVFGVQAQLSQQLFTIYLRQPYTFHLQRNSAHLIRNAINEVHQFTGTLNQTMVLITESLVLLGIGSLLLLVEPLGAVIVTVVLGVAASSFYRGTRGHIARWGRERLHHEGLRIQHLQQGLGGAKDIKLLGREGDFLAQYSVHNMRSARVAQFEATLQQFPRLWLELLAVVGLVTLVLTMLAQGRSMASIIPAIGLFAAAAFRMMPSIIRVLSSLQSLRYALPVIYTLHEELNLPAPSSFSRNQTIGAVSAFQSDIYVHNVTFTYPGAVVQALKELSIRIQTGESVGIVGSSGSGKSTLVDVILGLLAPDSGQVLVDGYSIQQNLRAWQDQIGYVPQSIFLTDDTLRRNVAFGLPDEQIDDSSVNRAIQAAQLEEFVACLSDGVETVVGERGVRLSGGQRQRIGIARALYHDPAVLVLDEATSALDINTEHGVMQAVRALHGNKTIIIIAHRLSTVEYCDRLYRLNQGRVVEESEPGKIVKLSKSTGH